MTVHKLLGERSVSWDPVSVWMHSVVLLSNKEIIFLRTFWCTTPRREGIRRSTWLYPVQLLRQPFGPLSSASLKCSSLLCKDLEDNFACLLVLFSLFQTYFQTLKIYAFLWMSVVMHFLTLLWKVSKGVTRTALQDAMSSKVRQTACVLLLNSRG